MNLTFTTRHGKSKEQRERVRAALDLGQANDAARTDAPAATPAPIPAAVGSRPELLDRLGLSDPDTSDKEILATLDALTAAKAKPVTVAVSKAKPDAAEAAYDKAWPDSKPKAASTRIVTAEDKLYALAWGNDKKRA